MRMTRHIFLLLLIVWTTGCAVKQNRPVLTPFADGEFWVVTQPLHYPIPNTEAVINIPAGFVTDFASIPRLFWTVFPRHGEYTTAAIVHDYLYWTQQCTRDQADNLFDMVMRDSDVSTATRFAIITAVRWGGGSAWEENQELKAEGEVRVVPAGMMNFDVKTKWADFRLYLREYGNDTGQNDLQNAAVPLYCSVLDEVTEPPVEEETDAQPLEVNTEPTSPSENESESELTTPTGPSESTIQEISTEIEEPETEYNPSILD